jgi:hypothetical protein
MIPKVTVFPPINISMPLDVSEAYLLFDQGLRAASGAAIQNYFQTVGYGDTSQYLLQLVYLVDDYDPVLFNRYQWESSGPYHNAPLYAMERLEENIERVCEDTFKTYMLIKSDIIADVKVLDTVNIVDTNVKIVKNQAAVTCQVLDVIKGQTVPSCSTCGYLTHKGNYKTLSFPATMTSAVPDTVGTTFQFGYWLDGFTYVKISDSETDQMMLTDSAGDRWIRPDSEYVVFLNLGWLTQDNSNSYYEVSPLNFGSCFGMYPVRNGLVYDPGDDFGFGHGLSGAGLPVAEWKSLLRARIYSILHP